MTQERRHARINCNGSKCGEFNCNSCYPSDPSNKNAGEEKMEKTCKHGIRNPHECRDCLQELAAKLVIPSVDDFIASRKKWDEFASQPERKGEFTYRECLEKIADALEQPQTLSSGTVRYMIQRCEENADAAKPQLGTGHLYVPKAQYEAMKLQHDIDMKEAQGIIEQQDLQIAYLKKQHKNN